MKTMTYKNYYVRHGNQNYRVALGPNNRPLIVARRGGDTTPNRDINGRKAQEVASIAIEMANQEKSLACVEQQNPYFGGWMQTYSGEAFFPLAPVPSKIHLVDIAHALSMQCRYAGHCIDFFSTAEHSLLMAIYIATNKELGLSPFHLKRFAKIALLHDAPEAYLFDAHKGIKKSIVGIKKSIVGIKKSIVGIKKSIVGIKAWEAKLQSAIYKRLGLYEHCFIKPLDRRITIDERNQNMRPSKLPWAYQAEALGIDLFKLSPKHAERAWLSCAIGLGLKEIGC